MKNLTLKAFFRKKFSAGVLILGFITLYLWSSSSSSSSKLSFQPNRNVKDIKSPYFGLLFANQSGTSSKYIKIDPEVWFEHFTSGLPNWRDFMPEITQSLQQYKTHNPQQNQSEFTSPKSVVIVDKHELSVGEHFVAKIQSRDLLGRNKQFGGDYYRVFLINKSTKNTKLRDGIPCSVQDHLNGTYTLSAPLLEPGSYELEVILCASIEMIAANIEWADGRIRRGFTFEAKLETGESLICNNDLILSDE